MVNNAKEARETSDNTISANISQEQRDLLQDISEAAKSGFYMLTKTSLEEPEQLFLQSRGFVLTYKYHRNEIETKIKW